MSWDYSTFRPPWTRSSNTHARPPGGARCLILIGPFVCFHASLCADGEGSPGLSLVAYVISNIISWAGSNFRYTEMKSSDGSKDKATGMKSKRGRLKVKELGHQHQSTEHASCHLDEMKSSDGSKDKVTRVENKTCRSCNKPFKTSEHLRQHQRNHSGDQPFLCMTCGRTFSQQDNLIKHHRIHGGTKMFLCEVCSRPFMTKGAMNEHLEIHRNEKSFICEDCGKYFRHKHGLVTHQRKRKYPCNVRKYGVETQRTAIQ